MYTQSCKGLANLNGLCKLSHPTTMHNSSRIIFIMVTSHVENYPVCPEYVHGQVFFPHYRAKGGIFSTSPQTIHTMSCMHSSSSPHPCYNKYVDKELDYSESSNDEEHNNIIHNLRVTLKNLRKNLEHDKDIVL